VSGRLLLGPFVACLVALTALLRSGAQAEALAASSYEDVYYVPPPRWLTLLSLGHREALGDLLWCRALVYQGEEFANEGALNHVFDYAEAIEHLDPDFRAVYVWIGSAGVYQPNEVTADDVRRSISFLERGRARFPEDGQLAWLLGATLSFELPPLLPVAERDNARASGVEHLMDAVRLGGAPEWVLLSSTSVLSRLGRADLAVGHLEEMYATVSDDEVRAQIAIRIEMIRSEAYGQAFSEANDQFEVERVRRYPYISPSLYFLIAPSGEEREPLGAYSPGLIDELTPDVSVDE